ncbi:MAG: hypothetical protein HC900_03975 [Methylacidiphilales bacterium]|nr:hypothetical protein [Candidatus Methylacidiphilales bacterium]
MPIVVALLAAVAGMVTYTFQKRADRKAQLIEIRRSAYRAYLAALLDQISKPTPETLIQLNKCEFDLFAVASDKALRKIAEFSNYMIATSYDKIHLRDKSLHKKQLAEAILAMRKDCFERSQLSSDEAARLLPME